jgi:two-component system cell cycle response regulator
MPSPDRASPFLDQPSAEDPRTVLVVDDTLENLQVLTALLRQHGYRVRQASSGRMALMTVQANPPDLILLDIAMPNMDGYDLCQTLKNNPQSADIPVIFLSARGDSADKVQGFRVGGADYITKPFQVEEVLVRVAHHITVQRQRIQILEQNRQLQFQETQLRQQSQREKLLVAAIDDIRQTLNVGQILRTAADRTRTFFSATSVMVYAFHCPLPGEGDRGDGQIASVVAHAIDVGMVCPLQRHSLRQGIDHPLDNPHQVQVIRSGTRSPLADWLHLDCGPCSDQETTAIAPLHTPSGLWGIVTVCHLQGYGWEPWSLAFFESLAGAMAVAIHHAELYEQLRVLNKTLEQLAHIDGLTKVNNRRAFDNRLTTEWDRHRQSGKPLTLVMCDVDFFKPYNDFYGHPTGDDCLKAIAQTLQTTLRRSSDWVARYGGEEFAILLAETNAAQARQAIHKVQAAIHELAIAHQQSPFQHVTLSFGIATAIPTDPQSPKDLIAAADRALYRAKQQGRNRCELADCP